MPKIFISYRRDDAPFEAAWIRDQFVSHFGKSDIFLDIDAIPFGTDFRSEIDERVGNCNYLIAVIGKSWLTVRDEDGQRRLDNPDDWVRLEIQAALNRKIPVIPLLLHDVRMPKRDELPNDLREFAYRQAHSIHVADRQYDIDKLIRDIDQQQKKIRAIEAQTKGKKPATLSSDQRTGPRLNFSVAIMSRIAAAASAAVVSGHRLSLRATFILWACLYGGLLTLSSLVLYLFQFRGALVDELHIPMQVYALLMPFIVSLLQTAFVFTAGTHDLLNPIRFSRRCLAIFVAGLLMMFLFRMFFHGLNFSFRLVMWQSYHEVYGFTIGRMLFNITFICWLVWIVMMVIRSAKWSRMLFFTRMCQNLVSMSLLVIAVDFLEKCLNSDVLSPDGILIGIGPAALWLVMHWAVRKSERENGSGVLSG